MSKIRLHGSSSGYTEIAPVAASGNNTLTYKTQFKSLSDAAVTTSKAQCNSGASHITLIEVSG